MLLVKVKGSYAVEDNLQILLHAVIKNCFTDYIQYRN